MLPKDRHGYSTGTTTDRHDYRLDRGHAIAIPVKMGTELEFAEPRFYR